MNNTQLLQPAAAGCQPSKGDLMTVSERTVGGVTILDVTGQVTLNDGADQIRDKVKAVLQDGRRQVLINLAQVSYVDSAGLGELVQAYSTVKKQQGQLKLLSPTKRLKDLLVITKLATVFDSYDDESAALASYPT
jgi:anti-sigma B factor antagonist